MVNVKKNKLYFKKDTGESIIITGIVDYVGEKNLCINYTVGYGASEKRKKEIIPYDNWGDFENNLELKQKINNMSEKEESNNTNNFKELRSILFDTLRGVKSGKIDEKKAKSISDISQTLINSAKVEVDYYKATGNNSKSNMIDE